MRSRERAPKGEVVKHRRSLTRVARRSLLPLNSQTQAPGPSLMKAKKGLRRRKQLRRMWRAVVKGVRDKRKGPQLTVTAARCGVGFLLVAYLYRIWHRSNHYCLVLQWSYSAAVLLCTSFTLQWCAKQCGPGCVVLLNTRTLLVETPPYVQRTTDGLHIQRPSIVL